MANFFPRWTNLLPLKLAVCGGVVGLGIVGVFAYYATPKAMNVGYQPAQPIPFSHKIHVDQIGVDCRYCHSFVDVSGQSNVPSPSTCWNCHQHVQKESPKLQPLRDRFDPKHPDFGKPLRWVRVHKVPDYVQFSHSAHVNRGVSCKSCHGRVDQMETVFQDQPLSMSWCLDCHRAPEDHLRPLEEVYNMAFDAGEYFGKHPMAGADGQPLTTQKDLGLMLKEQWKIQPRDTCAICHH